MFDNVFVWLAVPETAGGHERAELPGDFITASESARPVSDLKLSVSRDAFFMEFSGPAYAPGRVNNCLSDSLRIASERTLRRLFRHQLCPRAKGLWACSRRVLNQTSLPRTPPFVNFLYALLCGKRWNPNIFRFGYVLHSFCVLFVWEAHETRKEAKKRIDSPAD